MQGQVSASSAGINYLQVQEDAWELALALTSMQDYINKAKTASLDNSMKQTLGFFEKHID